MNLPIAVSLRLDAMAVQTRRVRASRNELLAALIASAELDRDALESMVNAYRLKLIGDVLPSETEDTGDSVVVPIRGPGRPAVGGGA